MKFTELGLSKELIKAVEDMNYQEATYIQSACYPIILSGGDIIGQSQTGTGKTAAFAIPIIEKLSSQNSKKPQAIILAPTRELALQVTNEIRKFSKYKEGLRVVTLYGGTPINKQIQELKGNNAIVVGTPGRILDHINRKTLRLDECKTIVLDEADEMLNMGFREDIEAVMDKIDSEHQTILFSATMPKAILEIAKTYQNNPVHIKTPVKELTASKITQEYYEVNQGDKKRALFQLMQVYNYNLAMIFCNTKKMVDDLCADLVSKGYAAAAIHGDMKQEMRIQVLEKFKARKINILICTDVAARGIDVDDMDIVFNYDYPSEDEYYVHRIGRTGRAFKDGIAVTLFTPRQRHIIKYVEAKTKVKLVKKELPKSKDILNMRLNKMVNEIETSINAEIPSEITTMVADLKDKYDLEKLTEVLIYKVLGKEVFDEIKAPNESNSLRATLKDKITLLINIGRKHDVQPAHIVSAIAESSGLDGKDIGKIKIRDRETSVDIPKEFEEKVIEALRNTTIKSYKVEVSIDTYQERGRSRSSRGDRDSSRRDRSSSRGDRGSSRNDRSSSKSDRKDRGSRGERRERSKKRDRKED